MTFVFFVDGSFIFNPQFSIITGLHPFFKTCNQLLQPEQIRKFHEELLPVIDELIREADDL